MENLLLTLFLAIFLATVINIILKKFEVSPIIGYILTGAIISYGFHFKGADIQSLDAIAEFGIVFLMFTIGLEISVDKIKKMKEILLVNGFLQVHISAAIIFAIAYLLFHLSIEISLIVAFAYSLSSTAIVLPYFKSSKDIYTPYGEKSTAILIYQDLAVIPILLLISFLTNKDLSITEVFIKTFISATIITLFMFIFGKKIIDWLLRFSSKTRLEELFFGAVFSIVLGASLLAEYLGFTYSLGAFLAGMIIADTKFRIKVESDISNSKDLLLGTFFFTVGTKIDILYFIENIHIVFGLFFLVMLIKAIVIYIIIRRKADKNTSVKSAIALCQVGEFSFAIFTLASNKGLIEDNVASFLMLISVLSMILTPFLLNNIYKISSLFSVDLYESDEIEIGDKDKHIIVSGFSILGRVVAKDLADRNLPFIIVSNDIRQVQIATKLGYTAYFGHLNKRSVLEALKVEKSSSVLITTTETYEKVLVCDAILKYAPETNIILKYESLEEKHHFLDLNIKKFVHAHAEVGRLLVEEATNCCDIKHYKYD
ncbi:cation:proton antiporter domain-containing protein [Aliarcobacter thereius]|uniref:Potassium transporter n=1 Tax=Aliarcobacter thereius TaxID=544718 RepID=A0A5R9GZ11_9BACT|nr:cation:proton antiporter [Aliarcobacter thereius]QBF15879.1 glutathione-regulated potassium-efflux system protein, KefB/KefC family [Aliarcobacter thereius LMG 24486]TLS72044.1 potassium transporter [Aliarcobacter thereius]TLS94775.1 potassium transporter [Aliarcobacter thereius]